MQNQKVDLNAKAFLAKCKQSNRKHRPVLLLYEKWALYVKGIKQSKIDKNSLYATLFAPHTIQYWERHHDLKIDPNHPVDWDHPSIFGIREAIKDQNNGLGRM
jgi:hypothetical protein